MYKLSFEDHAVKTQFVNIMDNAVTNYGGLLHKKFVPKLQIKKVEYRMKLSKDLRDQLQGNVLLILIEDDQMGDIVKIVKDTIMALQRSLHVANEGKSMRLVSEIEIREKECVILLHLLQGLNKN